MPALSFAQMTPPTAEKIPKEFNLHGDTRVDPYYWIKDVKNPKVKKLLKEENKYFDAYFTAADKKLIKTLVDETKSKIEETETSAPIVFGDYEYFSKTLKGKNYRQHLRREVGNKTPELIFDENVRAKGKEYFALRGKKISPDLTKIAWCFDYDGSGKCEIEIQDMKTLKFTKLGVKDVYWGNFTWAPDSQSLFYALPNKAWRPDTIWNVSLEGKSKKVLSEPEETFNLNVSSSTDDKHVFATSATFDESQVYWWDGKAFKVVVKVKPKVMVTLDHSDEGFFAQSNHDNRNYGVYSLTSLDQPITKWKEVIAPRKDAKLGGFVPIEGKIIYSIGVAGNQEVHVFDLKSSKDKKIEFKDKVYSSHISADGAPLTAFVHYSSPVTPPQDFILNLKTLDLDLIKERKSPTLKPELYVTELRFVKARDGEKIPIHMVYRKDMRKGSPQPTRLYGYGSYGITVESDFDETLFSLLDRGFIYVNAHVRGSDAQGESWYDNGRMMNKLNTFNDFVDIAKYLIKEEFTSEDLLAIQGGSAGGLLVGATLNQAPGLFRAAIAEVPFVDVLTTMLDPTIPLTTQEYLQWGNPNEKAAYNYIRQYSPYDNVREAKYPAILVQTGINDQQVSYWEPTKWVQKLRENTQSDHPIIMKVNMGAGHGGASGRYNYYQETAEKYVFLIKELQKKSK
jgi:oligopeptidase B